MPSAFSGRQGVTYYFHFGHAAEPCDDRLAHGSLYAIMPMRAAFLEMPVLLPKASRHGARYGHYEAHITDGKVDAKCH